MYYLFSESEMKIVFMEKILNVIRLTDLVTRVKNVIE